MEEVTKADHRQVGANVPPEKHLGTHTCVHTDAAVPPCRSQGPRGPPASPLAEHFQNYAVVTMPGHRW